MRLVILTIFLFTQSVLLACGGIGVKVHSGEIRYSFNTSSGESPTSSGIMNCSVVVTLYFDLAGTLKDDSILMSWGDGSFSYIFATEITQDSDVNIVLQNRNPYYKHVYYGDHIFDSIPESGYYAISVASQFRLDFVNNIGGGSLSNVPFYIEAVVKPDTSAGFYNHGPVMLPPAMQFTSPGSSFNIATGATDPDGDSLAFDLITPMEFAATPVPFYQFPNELCSDNPSFGDFTIDHQTGEITWNNACSQVIVTVTSIVRKFRNGILMGSMVRDQNLYVADESTTGIVEPSINTNIRIFPNPALFTLTGSFTGSQSGNIYLDIIAMDGRLIQRTTASANSLFNIDISHLAPGLYMLRVGDGIQSALSKFVHQ